MAVARHQEQLDEQLPQGPEQDQQGRLEDEEGTAGVVVQAGLDDVVEALVELSAGRTTRFELTNDYPACRYGRRVLAFFSRSDQNLGKIPVSLRSSARS